MSEPLSPTTGPTYRPVPDIAELLGIVVTRVHQLLRDRVIIAVRRDGVPQIPTEFLDGGDVVRGLSGTITLLTDAGYSDDEIVAWLFAADAPAAAGSVRGTGTNRADSGQTNSAKGSAAASGAAMCPMALLRSGRIKEVHRRAQVAGF